MEKENNFKKNGKRQLKVVSKVFPREYNRYVIFPEIKLSGKWLKDLGFNCGRFVTVSHRKNKITITLQKEKENEE